VALAKPAKIAKVDELVKESYQTVEKAMEGFS